MIPGRSSAIVYLDESGDLGFKFDAPYRNGGSSRYLTLAAMCVPSGKEHLPKRVIADLYTKFRWSTSKEKKWADMSPTPRAEFAQAALKLCTNHRDIHLHAMVVKKENVGKHIRKDPNKLYNFMTKLCLLERMSTYEQVTLVPDPRSIKVESGNSLVDYLQIELWFTKGVRTVLISKPTDSRNSKELQFTDMLAGLVQTRFEDRRFEEIRTLLPALRLSRLFFNT